MKGSSKLVLNQDTVMQAVQDYLDKHFTPKVKLAALVPSAESHGGGRLWNYETTIEEIVAEPKTE